MPEPVSRWVGKFLRPAQVLREAWLAPRAPHNAALFQNLYAIAANDSGCRAAAPRRGLDAYLGDHPPIAEISAADGWTYDAHSDEWRLAFDSSVFAAGTLRVKLSGTSGDLLIFLPGFYDTADDVLRDPRHPRYLVPLARSLGMSLAVWTWPLQGERGRAGLYMDMKSVVALEKEYARILPALGSSLWREFIHELAFALGRLAELFAHGQRFHVLGWSMGGGLAYYASALSERVATVIASGSCARVVDLIREGKTRVHSLSFYPSNVLAYFDLDDVAAELVERGARLRIIYGDADVGCLAASADAIVRRLPGALAGGSLTVIPGHGHRFSGPLTAAVAASLRQCVSGTQP